MGRTLPSIRPALEREIAAWDGYRRALRPRERAAFDTLMDAARLRADAAGLANRPLLVDAIFMSVLVAHQHEVDRLRREVRRQARRLKALEARLEARLVPPGSQGPARPSPPPSLPPPPAGGDAS